MFYRIYFDHIPFPLQTSPRSFPVHIPSNLCGLFLSSNPKSKTKRKSKQTKTIRKNTKPKQQSNQNNNNKIREKAYKNPQGEHLRPFCIL